MKNQFDREDDREFRIALAGDSCAHKTEIISIFNSTGLSSCHKTVETEYGPCKLQIYDTPSQKEYRELLQFDVRNSKAVLICCNLNVKGQLDSVKEWLEYAESYNDPEALIYIAAVDCSEGRTFDLDAIEDFAKQHGIVLFNVALDKKSSIDEMFNRIANDIKNLSSLLSDDDKKSCLIY